MTDDTLHRLTEAERLLERERRTIVDRAEGEAVRRERPQGWWFR